MGPQAGWQYSPEVTSLPSSESQKAFSYPADANQYNRRIPMSRSEGNNVNPFEFPMRSNAPYSSNYTHGDWIARAQPYALHDQRSRSPERGRGRQRSRSPVKILEDLDEDTPVDFLPNSARRGRSPHKKLFGENGWLGRSTSMNEMPSDKYRKPAGLKNFREKLKQRVEDFVSG